MNAETRAELDASYSDPDATATPWSDAAAALGEAGVYWVVTVRGDGRPHVTPVAGAWIDDAFFFSTGPEEQKAKNLSVNANVAVVTGCNEFEDGLDVVVEGTAVAVTDSSAVELLAKTLNEKYDNFFGFVARDAKFVHGSGTADAYVVVPTKTFAYARGASYSATRYR